MAEWSACCGGPDLAKVSVRVADVVCRGASMDMAGDMELEGGA